MSNLINTFLFERIKSKWKSNTFTLFSVAAIVSETSISAVSIPIMMFENNLTGGAVASVLAVVAYKIMFTLICSMIIAVKKFLSIRHP